ncbi:PDR/VanB family oxidoreductase [Ancylobacter rudongensis]|uniref:Vanillate O-demethylase ferredoxin subunit n=1 Tax=Ancylobacter rudongensis TaxID=177413 RepID=A0A1G4SYZ9_9HYPH|nr:PDR/VanB family oxidoreductase [Ancylobacter rudongensis]SCW74177.1 vanillate O-demethylase ferredoxin subunit [Ancylobacter rudongensis]
MSDRLIMKLRVVSARLTTPDVLVLDLQHPKRPLLPAWTPGAHVDVMVAGGVRQYSLWGDPEDRAYYRIAVKREAGGRGGSKWIHDHAKEGSELHVSAPRNHFGLDGKGGRHVLVAGGIGVTPILAMSRALAAGKADFTVHYCARSASEAPLLDELRTVCGDRLTTWFSQQGRRLDANTLLAQAAGAELYTCGPNSLTAALETAIAAQGFPVELYHREHFAALSDADFVPDSFEAVIASSGRTLHVPADRSLLEVLRDNHFVRGSSCEIGVCGSCECGYVSGDVIHRDAVLDLKARASRLMPCISRARGTVTLDL